MKKILFVCKKNSRRSQMAEGFAKMFGNDKVAVHSAGLEASQVDPLVLQVMAEVGIDIRAQTSNPLSDFRPDEFDGVISLCGCGVSLPQEWRSRPIFEDWQLDDPEGQPIEVFRRVRGEIKIRVERLLTSLTAT